MCHVNLPEAGTTVVDSSLSSKRIGSAIFSSLASRMSEVAVLNDFCSRRVAPAGAPPVSTECLAASAVFSSAMK